MSDKVKEIIIPEYKKKFNYLDITLRFFGFSRCRIQNSSMTKKPLSWKIYSCTLMLVGTLCAFYIIYYTKNNNKILLSAEIMTIYAFIVYYALIIFDVTFRNENRIINIYDCFYDIENTLHIDNTEFLRNVEYRATLILFILVTTCGITSYLILFFIFSLPYTVGVSGIIFLLLMLGVFYDSVNYVRLQLYVALRVRYLNVAMMTLSKTKLDYASGSFLFKMLFWRGQFNDRVAFHAEANPENVARMFCRIFELYESLKATYVFQFTINVAIAVFGTIASVLLIVDFLLSGDIFSGRLATLPVWNLLFWTVLTVVFASPDLFMDQISDSHRICSYAILKYDKGPALCLAQSVSNVLTSRDPHFSAYGMFHIDSRLPIRALAALFVFIMAFLQFAFPPN